MSSICHPRNLAAALGLLAMGVPCQGQEVSNEQLQEQVRNLQQALVESNKAEKKSTEQLNQVRERLEESLLMDGELSWLRNV